ncbi:MAG: hypothetical protein AAGK77_02525 [Pseudomonadota bacterium]
MPVLGEHRRAGFGHTGVHDDDQLTPEDLGVLWAHFRADAQEYARFVEGDGEDEGNGGALVFQGRDVIDTVVNGVEGADLSCEDRLTVPPVPV